MLSATTPDNQANTIVRFTNISDFDFLPEMGAMYGGIPYFVQAGKSMLCPFPIGKHLAKHLARQIILKQSPVRDEVNGKEVDGKGNTVRLWNPQDIEALQGKMISDAYAEERPAPRTEAEIFKDKTDQLNKDFPKDPTPPSPGTIAGEDAPNTRGAAEEGQGAPTGGYKDKAEVVAELRKLEPEVKFDARASKAELEKLLEDEVAKRAVPPVTA